MTTININKDLPISKTSFEDEVEFLKHLAERSGDYTDPDFVDTTVDKSLIERAEEAKRQLLSNPSSFRRTLELGFSITIQ